MSSIWKLLLIAELIFALSDKILAKDVPINVLPWNGETFSMTYDDGDPIHLEVAAPELAKRGLREQPFSLITSRLDPLVVGEWKKVLSGGREIGNHTVTHRHTSELTSLDEQNEVEKAKQIWRKILGFRFSHLPIHLLKNPQDLKNGLNPITLSPEEVEEGGIII